MSITEYHLSRRRARAKDGQRVNDGGVRERVPPDREPEPPAQVAAGSQRLEGRVAPPLAPSAGASTGCASSQCFVAPAPGVMPLPLDADQWATFDADTADILLPDHASLSDEPWTPVTSVHFGDQQLLIAHRGEEIDLVLPGGQRFTGSRASAFALAEALIRGLPAR